MFLGITDCISSTLGALTQERQGEILSSPNSSAAPCNYYFSWKPLFPLRCLHPSHSPWNCCADFWVQRWYIDLLGVI